ncbi:LOW QUALITY PROTEIN: uncharacterized protein LOC133185468 [Saccostrea echinata]|uniref:LOW QUALITY PROTEIN: uncharacterized protein LOC133185468 n=1 Tax=Saccostrea echinata TaxID=191078 RepID=UPI002A8002C1|nr:LOW QUALITY PROTEIN: uncharacterized protein LOC133185468 [Saccostrea echinata]
MSDYDYSDSFISDEDDAPRAAKSTGGRNFRKFKPDSKTQTFTDVYSPKKKVGGHRGGRGRGGRNTAGRTSVANSEPKMDGVVQRMLSAKNLKLNELRNQIEDMQTAFRDLKEENKLLKKMQHRQEKALVKYEETEGELPQIIARHQNEVRTLKENLRKTREKYERTDRYLRDAEDELDKVKGKLKRYKSLADQNNLKERDELQKENQRLQIELEEKEIRIKDLEKHIVNLNKNHRHELGIEMARNRDLTKQMDTLRDQNNQLEKLLKEKDKELQIKNIYANRSRAPHRLPASYGGTPHDTPPPKARKRAPSLQDLTPREKVKLYEEKRKEEERKQKESKKGRGDGPRMAFSDNIDKHSRDTQSDNIDKHSRDTQRSHDHDTYNSYGSPEKKEIEEFEAVIADEQQEKSRREKEEKEREEMERRLNQEREEKERREWERRDRERREREERERQEEERRKNEEADWKLTLEKERLKHEQEQRDSEVRRREEQQRRERQEQERRERERQEQERRAREEQERIEMDDKLQAERKKKDELLAKLKEIDEGKNKSKVPEKKEVDTFFVTSGNVDVVDKKTDKNKKKEKETDSFLFSASRKDSDGGLGSASSKSSYTFSKPIENMHSGKPARDDVTVPYIEKKKQQKAQEDVDEFGGYMPSFSSNKTTSKTTKKSGGIVFNDDFLSSKPPPKKTNKKSDLMSDLFGKQTNTTSQNLDDNDIFKPSTTKKTTTVNSSNKSSFPWDDDDSKTTAKKPATKRENSTSALFGGGSALIDDDFSTKDSSKMLPRRPRQTTTTFQARPAVTAVDHYDDDIEEIFFCHFPAKIEMETGSSVSKGTFAFKGKKKTMDADQYFGRFDNVGTHKQRLDVLQETWELMDTQIQILRSDLNSKIFDDLMKFAKSSHESFILGGAKVDSTSKEIPTAAFVTGVNTPDHGVMFSNLVASLQEKVSPLVAILKSKDCNSVKNALSKTLTQLFQNTSLFSEEEDDVPHKTRNMTCSMATLVSWYQDKYSSSNSSPKKRKSVSGGSRDLGQFPPIVILFEDLECFLPHILQDFISICRNYIWDLPLVFVFGIATSVSAVHRLLPNAVSSMLCMEKFQAPPSTEYLNMVINQILMTSVYPFKLGSKVFQLLLDIFLYHDFSVLNFIKGLQFAMQDHFFTVPVSHLCCPLEELGDRVMSLKPKQVEQVRRLMSFRGFVEGCPPSKQEDMLLNDKVTKTEFAALLKRIHTYHSLLYPVLKCLHIMVSKIPKHPLGKQIREVYSRVLKSFICDSEDYKECLELLRLTSKDELVDLIQQCRSSLEGDLPSDLTQLPTDLEVLLEKFVKIDEVTEEEAPEGSTEEALHLEKTDLHTLRKRLQEEGKKKKRLSPYEKLRNEAIDFFDELFRRYLLCPSSLPLYEIFYYDAWGEIKRHCNASPRSVVQMALSSPHHYLQCECCNSESGSITPSMPDICIAYKLHLECTQLINLYDWLQAFATVVTSDEELNEDKIKNPDKELQARFIRAVSELQFLGFVKPTKRKTDHVARLTWGGC